MKISVNMKEIHGPWGGGNNFYKSLKHYAKIKGHKIINHLYDNDIDLIMILCNLKSSSSASFTANDGIKFSKLNRIPIIQRINECDLRKNTSHVDNEIIAVSQNVDGCIFVSDWLKNDVFKKIKKENKISIRNGANTNIFKKNLNKCFKKIKIVTHHFSSNIMKGYNYYKILDDLIEKKELKQKIEFTVIGSHPKEIEFKNSRVLKLMPIDQVAQELNNYNFYITASEFEPGANHVVEALASGLPVLYLDSGSMKEYVGEFGLSFKESDFESKIIEMLNLLEDLSKKVNKEYKYSAEIMCNEYFNFFEKVIHNFNGK